MELERLLCRDRRTNINGTNSIEKQKQVTLCTYSPAAQTDAKSVTLYATSKVKNSNELEIRVVEIKF
jgi:hypothetical protein